MIMQDERCEKCKGESRVNIGPEIALLSQEMEGIQKFISEVATLREKKSRKQDWTIYEDGAVDKIYYKLIKGTKLHTTYIET